MTRCTEGRAIIRSKCAETLAGSFIPSTRANYVSCVCGLIVPDVLPMSEGSAPDVQAGQSNVEPVREQRPVGEVLGEAPVDGVINIARNQPPVLQHFLDVGV